MLSCTSSLLPLSQYLSPVAIFESSSMRVQRCSLSVSAIALLSVSAFFALQMVDERKSTKDENRGVRDAALRSLNEVAATLELPTVTLRASSKDIIAQYKTLCSKLCHEHVETVRAATDKWHAHGGCDLPTAALASLERELSDETPELDGVVHSHRILQQEFYGARKGAFRLCSKAFMLTFNSIAFVSSPDFWAAYQAWVEERARHHEATYWSCTLEISTHSQDAGRIHLHGYWSWHGQSRGVDQRNTDAWVFKGVRPRVDVNSDRRGPSEWLRATQHGHFYVQVFKIGTVYSATNYAPWERDWIPDHWWFTKLWKQHKLDHDQFLRLSMQYREGHDRRRAWVDAVRVSESASAHVDEQTAALSMIESRSKDFKPLPPALERWKMQYDDYPTDRYMFLVLYGPSRTGKSRLARSLFGAASTLVVDIENAAHPNLKAYRRGVHKAILLDEMKSPSFLVHNKKVLQAHIDGAWLGDSPTQQYLYEVFLWRTPIIITTNNWVLEHLPREDREWIGSNSIAYFVGEPVWVTLSQSCEPAPSTPRDSRAVATKRTASVRTPINSPEHKHAERCCDRCGQRIPR